MGKVIPHINNISKYVSTPFLEMPIIQLPVEDFIRTLSLDNIQYFKQNIQNKEQFMKFVEIIKKTSASIIKIKGKGASKNVIPDKCEILVDVRYLPHVTINEILNGYERLIETLPDEDGLRLKDYIKVEKSDGFEPSFFSYWKKSQDLKKFFQIVTDTYNTTPYYGFFPGGADAEFYRNKGYCSQTIVFGPGKFEHAHTVNGYVEIKDFIDAIKVYTIFAYRFLTET